MAVSGAWRHQCCNVLLNALCDDERSSLAIQITPYARRGSVGKSITMTLHNNGRILASCRHDHDSVRNDNWADWLQVLTYHALRI